MCLQQVVFSFTLAFAAFELGESAFSRVKQSRRHVHLQAGCPADGVVWERNYFDGFGAVFTSWISTYVYTKEQNNTFCTLPYGWPTLGHVDSEESTYLWHFVGGRFYGPPAEESTRPVEYRHYGSPDKVNFRRLLPSLEDARTFYDEGSMDPKLKPKPNLTYDSNKFQFSIAWHIRRGDVRSTSDDVGGFHRFTSNGDIAKGLTALSSLNNSLYQNAEVHIFSEGEVVEFGEVDDVCHKSFQHCEWHLDASVADTFHHFVHADILVIATSSFSASAGLLRLREGALTFFDKDLSALQGTNALQFPVVQDSILLDVKDLFSMNPTLRELRGEAPFSVVGKFVTPSKA